MDEFIGSVGKHVGQLVRVDISTEIAISYLYDGNTEKPRTCQWRVHASNETELKQAVKLLVDCLVAKGIKVPHLDISGKICWFQDEGIWPHIP